MTRLFRTAALLACLLIPAGALRSAPADPAGTWNITLSFIAGQAVHTAVIARTDSILTGTYRGALTEGKLSGKVRGTAVEFIGVLKIQAQYVAFRYTGVIEGDTMKGTVDLGEFWSATWTAQRNR